MPNDASESADAPFAYRALGYALRSDIAIESLTEEGKVEGVAAVRVAFTCAPGSASSAPLGGVVGARPATDSVAGPDYTVAFVDQSERSWSWHAACRGAPLSITHCDLDARTIRYVGPVRADPDGLASYLVSPLLPYWARRDGRLALHGAVIDVGGAAVILLGDKGMGKSTLAAAFLRRGCALHADDVAVIGTDGQTVHRGSKFLRANADSMWAVFGDGVRLRRSFDGKHVLDAQRFGGRGRKDGLPVRGIFQLLPFADVARPAVARMRDDRATMALLRNLSGAAYPVPDAVRRREFVAAAALAAAWAIHEVARPHGFAALDRTVSTILEATCDGGAQYDG